MATLEEKIKARIAVLEACTHTMCSMSDEASEQQEVNSLRRLLCPHEKWKIYNGVEFVEAPFNPNEPSGCYCMSCGISAREQEYQ